MQHVQSVLDDAAASPIVAFAANELACVLLEAPSDISQTQHNWAQLLVERVNNPAVIPIAVEIDPKGGAPAQPLGTEEAPWSANIALVSDYRIAGVTSSGHGGALQGGIDYEGPTGWSAGIWGSTISLTEGSNVEVDLYGAKSFEFGDAELSLGAVLIVLPGGNNAAAGLLTASISSPIGPVDTTLATRYVWPQGNTNDNDDFYVSLDGRTAIGNAWGASLTLGASVGFERGEFAVEETKLDWSVSLTANVGGVDIGLSYVATDLRDESGAPGFILSITRTF